MRRAAVAGAVLVCLAAAVPQGCGRTGGSGLEAAIVDKADFLCRIDYGALKGTPVSEHLEDRVRADSAGGDLLARFEETVGIDEDDIAEILITGSLGDADLDSASARESAQSVDAAIGVALEEALTEERLAAGLELLVRESGGARLEKGLKGDRTIFRVIPDDPDEPDFFCALAGDGRTVYGAFSESSLAATLGREKKGATLPASLKDAEKGLGEESQLRYVFMMPPQMQVQLRNKVKELEESAAANPGAGMVYGFLKPFFNLKSIALGMRFSKTFDVRLMTGLGSDAEAAQAAAIVQSVAVPFLTAQLARQGGGNMSDYADRLAVSAEGSVFRLALSLEEQDLEALRQGR
jgi:hypothetical protein